MSLYVALLRAINLGRTNVIPMQALRAAFEALGFADVRTYIQSGNVIFRAPAADVRRREARIERALAAQFSYDAVVMLKSHAEMRRVVSGAPAGFGSAPGEYRYDVTYLKAALRAPEALESLPLSDGVDRAWAGDGVIYSSRLISGEAQSRPSRAATLPIYRQMTTRTWNTTTKLLQLMDG